MLAAPETGQVNLVFTGEEEFLRISGRWMSQEDIVWISGLQCSGGECSVYMSFD